MNKVDLKSIHFTSVVPQFTVNDLVRTAEYYRDVLGFQIAGYWKSPPVFGIVERDDVRIFLSQAKQSEVRTGRVEGAYDAYFHISGVDALAIELRKRGATILEGPEDRTYEQRELVVKDCNGLILAFGEVTNQPTT